MIITINVVIENITPDENTQSVFDTQKEKKFLLLDMKNIEDKKQLFKAIKEFLDETLKDKNEERT
ncbi:MAG: hypothetical protein KAX49_14050 [Halanaerobiales bacterium]|nr:hypothetical protein [Halanaerobiales bacterium]